MKSELALVPRILSLQTHRAVCSAIFLLGGIVMLGLLARISIPLPFSPVPITGQTFGVALISLLSGRSRAFAVVSGYLLLGAAGLPLFANGGMGLALGPTSGYLLGMLLASLLVGELADRGWTKSFLKSFLAVFCGSILIFSCGLFVLSFYVSGSALWMAGLFPFLPGDFIKNILAAGIVSRSTSALEKR